MTVIGGASIFLALTLPHICAGEITHHPFRRLSLAAYPHHKYTDGASIQLVTRTNILYIYTM